MYHKILIPLDGSKRAEKILPHVEHLALTEKARVVLLQVIPFPMLSEGYADVAFEQILEENKRHSDDALAYLTALEGEFREKGIDAACIVENGPIVDGIIRVAQRENTDLIAMASHGRTGLSRVFYGSVAAGILNAVDRPLLLIRARNI